MASPGSAHKKLAHSITCIFLLGVVLRVRRGPHLAYVSGNSQAWAPESTEQHDELGLIICLPAGWAHTRLPWAPRSRRRKQTATLTTAAQELQLQGRTQRRGRHGMISPQCAQSRPPPPSINAGGSCNLAARHLSANTPPSLLLLMAPARKGLLVRQAGQGRAARASQFTS